MSLPQGPSLPRRRSRSVGMRLAFILALVLLAPTVVGVYFAWNAYSEQTRQATLAVRQFAVLAATIEQKFFDDTRQLLQNLAAAPALRTMDAPACRREMERAIEGTRMFAGLGLYDLEGRRVCGTDRSAEDVSGTRWFEDVLTFRGFTVSEYTQAPESPFPVIVASLGVFDDRGMMSGVVSAVIQLYWLTAFLDETRLPPGGVFFLLDQKGEVLANASLFRDGATSALPREEAHAFGRKSLSAVVQPDLIDRVLTMRQVDFEAVGNDGVRRLYSSVALPYGNVTVLFGLPASTRLGWIERDLITRLLGLGLILVAGIGAAWYGARRLLTRWVAALRATAFAYGRGDYATRTDFSGAPTELRDLGDTLLMMGRRIEMREEELRQSIAQKDGLIKEIHHRVKNNLQIVSSLLNLHAKSVTSERDRMVIEEVKTRVGALALVHRHLYEGGDVQLVDLKAFLGELSRTVVQGLSHTNADVALTVEAPDLTILADKAVPIALLVVEALTNAIKHAFPDGREGHVAVRFIKEGDEGRLIVADDGVGMPEHKADDDSIGFRLMKAFAQQIGGDFSADTGNNGTAVSVSVDLGTLTRNSPTHSALDGRNASSKRSAA